jgi:tetratricopeptide (TPR) repeat protein
MTAQGDGNSHQRTSAFWRVVRFFDPAQPGFVWRMTRAAAVLALFGCCALAAVTGGLAQTRYGRFGITTALLMADEYERALETANSLIDDYPTDSWHHYRIKAQILRYQDKPRESLAVYDDALEVFPDDWWPHSHRCYYTAILTDDPASAMDSCDMSIELEPDWPAIAYDRRAVARALAGDLVGAEHDMAIALELWLEDDRTELRDVMVETRTEWLEELRSGRNPIGEQEIADELSRH